jgi:hypothetical protein
MHAASLFVRQRYHDGTFASVLSSQLGSSRMNSQALDAHARKRIEKNLRAMVSYVDKLTGRMHQKRFPADDPLKVAAEDARVKV